MPIIGGKVVRSTYTKLQLNELSSVDRPAQVGARALILKRDYSADERQQMADAGHALPDGSYPIANAADLKNAIQSIGRASNPARAKAHIITRAKALGATNLLPDDWQVKKEHTMTIEQLQAEVEKLTGQLTSAQALIATEKARADTAEAAVKASESKMKDMEEEMDETKKALLAATDESIQIGGTEFKKSVAGDAAFAIAKAAAEERDLARFEKRAETEFGSVVGTVAEKVLVLKARERMDEPTQKALDAILTSCAKMIEAGFERLGQHGNMTPTEKQAATDFDGKAAEIAKRDGIPMHAAMQKARQENPDLFAQAYEGASAAN